MEKKFALGDVVYVKGMVTEYDKDVSKYWFDVYAEEEGLYGDWLREEHMIPASEIENNMKSSLKIWDLAARVAGLPQADFEAIFGVHATVYGVLVGLSPATVERMINKYEQSKIRIGDLVEYHHDTGETGKGVYLGENIDYYFLMVSGPGLSCPQKCNKDRYTLTKLKSKAVDILGAL